MTKIKICGLMSAEDAELASHNGADFGGVVMFFPKSHRNTDAEKAAEIVSVLKKNGTVPVAVTVEPASEQIKIIKSCGFEYIQIHGNVDKELIEKSPLPVIKAFNVKDIDMYEIYAGCSNIEGYVFDAAEPGSGRTFEWDIVRKLRNDGRMKILAGGLSAMNVADAINEVRPDCVDISSGVENDTRTGKDAVKIKEFVSAVKRADTVIL